MSKTALAGPLIVVGQEGPAFVPPGDNNPNLGPSPMWGGPALLDPRLAKFPSGAATTLIPCWPSGKFLVADFAPSTKSLVSIAAAQVPVTATALTLVSSTALGVTVGDSIVDADTGATVTGLLRIDALPALIAYGSAGGPVAAYDPATMIGRTLQLQSAGDDSGAVANIIGYDVYRHKVKETITLGNTATVISKKALKWVLSITPVGTLSGSNLNVGQSDTLGLPLRADRFAFADIAVNDAKITASTGFTAAVTTDPATATTGDVRGTYALQTAADGTKRTQIWMAVDPTNMKTVPAGWFGVAQFGSGT